MGTVKRRHVVNSTDTEPARAQVLPVDAIHIGKRYRKDMGDIAGLADDIANHVGLLLHPVVVRRVGRQWQLVCGARRLQAEKLLGRKTVPVTAHYNMDDATALRAEGSENIHHKPFKLSEAVHYKRDLLELIERVAAKQRQREHGKTAPGRKHSGQVAHSDKRPRCRQGRQGDGHRARLKRPRPSSTPLTPSPRSSASCSKTWTAPAG